jgi:diketogulonate reductase-like aldo/keto reductase
VKYLSLKRCLGGELKLSPIGFGMGAGIEPSLYAESDISTRLKSARNNGINWFDAAESYHLGYAEEVLGKVLARDQDAYFFTKFSPISGSSRNLKKALDSSLLRLKRDHVDMYQMHWPSTNVEDYQEIFDVLKDFKREGKIRAIGVCNFDLNNFINMGADLLAEIASNQIEFSLFNSENHRELKEFHDKNEILPIAYGIFEGIKRSFDSHRSVGPIKNLSEKYSISKSQVVVNWVARKNLAVLTSSRSLDRTLDNIAALGVNIDHNDLMAIDEFYPGRSLDVSLEKIRFDESITNYFCYVNQDEALENRLSLKPGPLDLAGGLKSGSSFKPIKLLRKKESGGTTSYFVLNGMVRYWAWRFAYPNKNYVPSHIVDLV